MCLAYQSGSKGGTSTVQKVFTDNPFDEAGNLKPNIKYQTGEFKYNYETDANGRISNWNTDNLQLTERDGRLNYNSDSLGKIEGDHAGHIAEIGLVAHQNWIILYLNHKMLI